VVVGFQQKRKTKRRERDAKVRLLLRTMIDSAQQAKQLLEAPPEA
jgi:hypothetical protein